MENKGVPLTPDILTLLKKDAAGPQPSKRYSDSTQFLLFLVLVASLLLSTFPVLIHQSNSMFGNPNSNDVIPVLNPTPTPDSSLLFFLHREK